MFNRESQLTTTESVVESADSAVESADCTTESAADPVKIGLWVLAFRVITWDDFRYMSIIKLACLTST